MKKLITAALALSMTLSAFAPCVFADDNMEKIIIDVKNRAGITDEYSDFSSDYYENDNMTVYQLGWSDDEDKKSVSITYNSDDVITSYHKYEWVDDSEIDLSIPAISADEAKAAAQSFIDKLNPNNKGEFTVGDRNNVNSALSGDYSFNVERLKNGAKINNSYGRINIERDTGEVKSMYISYEHIDSFADISSVVPADEAKKAYKSELGLELVYQSYSDDKKIVMFPAYVEKENNKYINAITGEIYEPKNNEFRSFSKYEMADAAVATNAQEAGGGMSLSRAEREELDKIDGLISKTDIEAQARNNKLFDISKDMKLGNIRLNRNYYDNNAYSYSMSFEGDDKYAYVTADAKTGEIQSYFCNLTEVVYRDSISEVTEEIDEETVKANADKILNELAKSKKDEYEFTNVRADIAIYTRVVNGIKVQGDTINITTDKNGKLDSYSMNYTTNTEFPDIKGILTEDSAADKMFDATAYEITYIPEWNEDGTITAEAVYKLSSYVRLNPFTGESVNYRNEHDTEIVSAYEYSDVEDHWAKEQIKALATYGIGFDGGEFKPNEKITERDFLYILKKTFEPYMFDDVVYKMDGSNTEASSTEPVTRESAAVMMIKKMGAESYAKYEDIYVTPFKDVTENKGYIALLSAMKVVKGDENGNFNPKNNMTRAEAACMIYNYLSR